MTMAEPDGPKEPNFLRGGGATGALIARYDWASTPLGSIDTWPQSLKTATSIILQSPMPMALLWGDDGVLLYNDGYAKISGGRHPHLLGGKVREAWPEIAEFDDHVMKAVLGGATLEYRDQMFLLQGTDKLQRAWFNLDYSPVPDESGRIAGVLAVVVETTGRVLAERKAAAQASRERRMFEQAPGFIAILSGPDHVYEFRNETHKRLFGDENIIGRSRKELSTPYAATGLAELDRVFATGERYVAHARAVPVRRDPCGPPKQAYLDFILEPMTDERGQVTGIFVEGFDVTEQVCAQAAAEESNRKLSAALAVARLGAFEFDQDAKKLMLDARAREIFGFGDRESVTARDVLSRLDSRDRSQLQSQILATTGRRELECRIRLPDGSVRHIVSIGDTIAGPDGKARRVVGVVDDVTERRRAEQRQRLLINELNHRVKNTLATVQSIAAQTLRSAPDLSAARDSFEARLMALAAAHDLLTRQGWRGASLTDVVTLALAPFEATRRGQISRSGPPVWLTAHRALALSLALHELAANAAKFGALSSPGGRVTIYWRETGDAKLALSWVEEGGPPVSPPVRAGFGTRLLQRSLVQELRGEVALDFALAGVRCEICWASDDNRIATAPELAEA